ncbi:MULTISPECIES: envelope stress response membrane protein PspB [Shewanella]|jgi:phage shock protein B|uniref:Phage shock protein B n=1 Tax=Shewanella fodinae TaxID=552357 RepID=A0A4R2FK00_9GAMM|nr:MULTISPECIES: envelope stress response membrane protein PspB [Shewanella]MBO1273211.1 envelope stress response membrane protein PspB [Shewanella sp. 4t3-1-2LB]MCL2905048.1 envelope stress response membrane protein PspB [Shewanella fodinae]TCN90220.1 phage shock protein B [Shewanella fodinae]GGY89006.1 phage shock protein B [Shewanella fodinae]
MDMDLLMAPLILFMIFVAPIWLILHYRSKRQVGKGLTDEEFKQLNELVDKAEKMSQRITTLESILDAESPEWRQRHDR